MFNVIIGGLEMLLQTFQPQFSESKPIESFVIPSSSIEQQVQNDSTFKDIYGREYKIDTDKSKRKRNHLEFSEKIKINDSNYDELIIEYTFDLIPKTKESTFNRHLTLNFDLKENNTIIRIDTMNLFYNNDGKLDQKHLHKPPELPLEIVEAVTKGLKKSTWYQAHYDFYHLNHLNNTKNMKEFLNSIIVGNPTYYDQKPMK